MDTTAYHFVVVNQEYRDFSFIGHQTSLAHNWIR